MNFSARSGETPSVDQGLPQGFIQQFEVKNGAKCLKHPNPPHIASEFAIRYRGCYFCGQNHVFRACPRRDEPRAVHKMRFNMYCHQPKLYFKVDCSGFSNSGRDQNLIINLLTSYSLPQNLLELKAKIIVA